MSQFYRFKLVKFLSAHVVCPRDVALPCSPIWQMLRSGGNKDFWETLSQLFLGKVCICIAVDYPEEKTSFIFCHCPSLKHILFCASRPLLCHMIWETIEALALFLRFDVVNLRVLIRPNKSSKETYFIRYLDKYFISDQQKTHKWCIRIFHDFSVQRKNPNIYTVWVYMYMGIFKVQVIYKGQSCVT